MEYSLDDALAVLERTPTVISAMLHELPEGWTSGNEGGESWNPVEVLGHLIHGERGDWVTRARTILDSGETETFHPFDRSAHLEESRTTPLQELLDKFTQLRCENIEEVKGWSLTDDDLDRRGRHPDFGPVTLRELFATWVVHDLGHVAQIARVMAKQYTTEVGSWAAYLPVLGR